MLRALLVTIMQIITIDRYDLALLDAVQRDGNATNATLGEAVHLSPSQISRRLQRLAEAGIIASHAALLDAAAIGLGVTAFAHVILERHGKIHSDARVFYGNVNKSSGL